MERIHLQQIVERIGKYIETFHAHHFGENSPNITIPRWFLANYIFVCDGVVDQAAVEFIVKSLKKEGCGVRERALG